MNRILIGATLVVAGTWTRPSAAAEGAASAPSPAGAARAAPPGCAGARDANAIVRCALAASPEVRQARAQLDALAGRRATAEVWLPSNPTVSGTLARRIRPAPESVTVLNWSVALSQELEIAGQRGARVDAVEAEIAASARRAAVAEQEVAAAALSAYYQAIAAREAHRFALDLVATAQALATYAGARAQEALVAGVEADVARAEAARIGLLRFEAERRVDETRTGLAVLLDLDERTLVLPDALPAAAAASGLPPGSLEEQALRLRGEVAAAEMEQRVLERRLVVIQRERVPNPTLSVFAERGEIDDQIYGVGLTVPLPLPAPVGRTRAGEIAETLAQIRAAASSGELIRRRVRVEVARAVATFQARQSGAALFAADLLEHGRADLAALREAITSRQLSLRDGLPWQRSLIELLQGDIEARLGRALAWVELRRVVGLPLVAASGGAP